MEERGVITISVYGEVLIPKNEVWMTMQDISDMLGVFGWRVRKAVEDIYKKGELSELETRRRFKENGIIFDGFNIEMVVAVVFKVPSKESEAFRRYILERVQKNRHTPIAILKYDDGEYSYRLDC